MNAQGSHEPTQISSSAHIDQVCDEFEKACLSGKRPMIEEFLLRAPPEERDRLLAELLEIELDCRQRALSFVQVEDYRIRFPERANLVDSVFRRVVKTRRLADYELQEELGRGGMGVVYKARQVYLHQTVAVKILPHRVLDDTQAVSRFRREMQSIGGLNHPNIVRAYNAGEAAGVHFLVMEYVDGVNLQRYVNLGPPHGGPVGIGAACEIIRQAALGLQHAHEHALVHRDIKPANLMLARDGAVKLLDLGLARLHAERRGEDRPQDRLTQPGATMGTVDFMAPEQWENSATADIRADIYSLGCTLFYLLVGKPPYAEPEYDTSRRKLMAHAVAPIPSLVEKCGDVPHELQAVLETMMAKRPQDRYAAPAEVAEAIAEFADAEELAEIVAELPPHELCVAADNTDVPRADTPRRPDEASGGSHPRRRTQSRWSSRQRFRRNVTIGVAAGLTVAVCGLLAWSMMQPRESGRSAASPPKSSATGTVAVPAAYRESLAADLALLPGLNGPWWFDEMPWMTPFVRQALAEKAVASPDLPSVLGENLHGYQNTNSRAAEQWLWQAASRCRDDLAPCQQLLLDQLKARCDENRPRDDSYARFLENAMQEFIAGHHGGSFSAVDLHTVALLEHALAALKHDDKMAQTAKKRYDKALKDYGALPKGNISLRPLCLVDSAVLDQQLLGDFKDARQRLEEALEANRLPVMFHVSTLVECGRLAAAAANGGDYEDYRFVYAKKVLDGSEEVKPTHPLAAYIAESYAASLLDQWKVEEAGKQYQIAQLMRSTAKEEKDPAAAAFLIPDRLGTALSARYRGNLDAARRVFKSLAEDIEAAIDQSQRHRDPGAPAGDLARLRNQLAQTREAWADCELYSGAASDGKVNLSQAADNYEQARKFAADRGDVAAIDCKLAMIQALRGKEKSAKDALADSDRMRPSSPSDQRAELARRLADAVLAAKAPAIVPNSAGPGTPAGGSREAKTGTTPMVVSGKMGLSLAAEASPSDGAKQLRSFLDQFKLSPVVRDSSRREILEMQLFAAELLLSAELEEDARNARRDLKYLDALLGVFQDRRDMRPYLRRYYELAMAACNKTDLTQIAHYLLDARMAERRDAPAAKATLVLFNFSARENFAIFLPQDGRPGKRFELNVTRDQIKSAKGKPLHLNDELVALIKGEIAAKRPLEIFWDDAASRPSEDADALADADWPFDSQLELAKLRKPPAPSAAK